MNINLHSVVIGVRFEPMFQLADDAGQIFDKILKSKKSFSRDIFSRVQYNGLERILHEDEKEEIINYIKVNPDNIILSLRAEQGKSVTEMVNDIKNKFEEVIVHDIINTYQPSINRIGFVFTFNISEDKLDAFKKKYFAPGVDVAEFRFSRSTGVLKGATYKDGSDYINRIFALSKQGKEK